MSEYTKDQKSQIRNCQLMNVLGFITGAGITIAYYPESYYYYFRIQTDLFYIFRTWLFIAHLTQPLNLQCSASLLSLVYLTILLTRKLKCLVIPAPLLTIENVAISDGDLVQYVSYSSLKIRKYSSRKLWTWKHLWEKVETFLRKVEM